MRQIKKMQAEHIYLIEGAGSANSSFFERESDCKDFMRLADKHLADYLYINSFQNNRDGWVMIVTTKSAESIITAYNRRRAQSKKCKSCNAHSEVWRILSDQIRILLSTYVKITNQKSGRTGGKVRGNYLRFIFENADEVMAMQKTLSKQQYDQSQSLNRYRPAKKLFNIKKKLVKCSIYMTCAFLTTSDNIKKLGMRCLNLAGLTIDVLRHLIHTTLNHHFPPNAPNSHSNYC